MSSPSSPEPQKSSEGYQSAETDGHSHLALVHACQCSEFGNTTNLQENQSSKNENANHHHHSVLNISHIPSPNMHPMAQSVHVHVHPPPNAQNVSSKIQPPTCTCHLQEASETNQEIHEAAIVQNRKLDIDDRIEVSPLPPALPPRPPPRPRTEGQGTLTTRTRHLERVNVNRGIRKYVFWCCACGGISTILGALFLAVYFILRSYTSTLVYFESIPTFIPAAMLMLTGLCVMSLARRKNRYSYLIKVCGVCCLVCALTCVLVTITTTVIHMNRLQMLRECVYTQKTRTCTCFSVRIESQSSTDDGLRYIFDSTPDCEVIHGALYTCLRAMFGLSVSGILICIFSCMLAYQLLSHERKKMYWEQLELRCRSFYSQPGSTHGSVRGPPLPPATYCSCCEECRYPPIAVGPQVYPWDAHHASERFWTPGRVGNFYSPNPGEENTPQAGETRERSGWSWRRLPWSRNPPQPEIQRDSNSLTYQGVPSSADSQYGFSNPSGGETSLPISGSTGSYSVLDNRPPPPVGGVYIWGPPPPYSNPNSPARRPLHSPTRYHHIHHHPHTHEAHCQLSSSNLSNEDARENTIRDTQRRRMVKDNYENTGGIGGGGTSQEASETTDTSSCQDMSRISHTLPVRKMKKRVDINSIKSVNQSPNRANVKQVFPKSSAEQSIIGDEENGYHEPNLREEKSDSCRFLPRLQGVENAAFQKQENQQSPQKNQQTTSTSTEPSESEVYFADVSSCCNISVRNDGQDSLLYDEAIENQKGRLMSLHTCIHKINHHNHQSPNKLQNSSLEKLDKDNKESQNNSQILQKFHQEAVVLVGEDEEYLAHRMGKREMSTRSRLPFPLPADLTEREEKECHASIPKDISQNSLCSQTSVQTPLTEITDDGLSPVTPTFVGGTNNECCSNNKFSFNSQEQNSNLNLNQQTTTIRQKINQCGFNNNPNLDEFLAPDAQYEVIQENSQINNFRQNYEPSNLTNTISGLNNYLQSSFGKAPYNSSPKNVPPKTLNLQSPGRRIGSNISSLIQNLGVNQVGLYEEAHSDDLQTQACHSDATIDSGWQSSSSDKAERIIQQQQQQQQQQQTTDNHHHDATTTTNLHKPVNV